MNIVAVRDDWAIVALAAAVACAVLAGAVFLATVIRPARREDGTSPGPLLLLGTGLLVALAVLVPRQGEVALGLEVALLGLALGIVVLVRITTGGLSRHELLTLLPALPAVAFVVGGLLIETDAAAGFFWALAGIAIGVVVALREAWLELVAPGA